MPVSVGFGIQRALKRMVRYSARLTRLFLKTISVRQVEKANKEETTMHEKRSECKVLRV